MKVYHFQPGHDGAYARLISDLLEAPVVHTGEWQSMDTSRSKYHDTFELEDVSLVWDTILSRDIDTIVPGIDHEWADDHFNERVSGDPLNPPPSHVRWPYAVRGNSDHTTDQTFSHTYPERFWPKHAGHMLASCSHIADMVHEEQDPRLRGLKIHQKAWQCDHGDRFGVRFPYGDLEDVVQLLVRNPLTRQAFLPVWFPEDTGAIHGQRVPCTLGYHFMVRGNKLTTRYYIRSCDAYRHLSNDIYFAARLAQWTFNAVNAYRHTAEYDRDYASIPTLELGGLVMHITSLHAFTGDKAKLLSRVS